MHPATAPWGRRLAACFGAGALALYAAIAAADSTPQTDEPHASLEEPQVPGLDEDPFAGRATLTRPDLVAEALRRNPSLAATRAAWQAALARPAQERAWPDPMLEYATGPWSYGKANFDDAHRVELRQPLPFPGKLALRGEIADAEATAAGLDFEAARVRLAQIASSAYDDWRLATRAVAITEDHLKLLAELQAVATARYAAGLVPQTAPLQAESERAMLEHRFIEVDSERRVTGERINALLHRRPELTLPPPALDEPPPAMPPPVDVQALAVRALASRPELRAADLRSTARARGVELAKRDFLPDFEVFGMYDGFWQESPLRGAVGVAMNLPLDLSRRRAALDEARAELARARSERARTEDQVRLAVVSSAERLREAQHLYTLSRDRVLPAARDRLAATRAAFETGQESLLGWIDAERALRSAELDLETALAGVGRRHAELERALGALPALPEGELR